MYYYLSTSEIIQKGDEFCWNDSGTDRWSNCRSSIGGTIESEFPDHPYTQVRRKIKTTKLGNVV